MLAVLVDEGVSWIPYPPKPIPLGRSRVEQLNVVEDGLCGVLEKNLTVTVLGGKE